MTITNPAMTRFLLTLPQAVELVLWATVKGEHGDLWVRKMPGANVVDLAKALAHGLTGDEDYPHVVVGTRPGEKLHEVLVSEEEMWRATEYDDHFCVPSWEKTLEQQDANVGEIAEYASNSDPLMTHSQLLHLLREDGWCDVNGTAIPFRAAA
jgi:UDP-glucose 4-epimerase